MNIYYSFLNEMINENRTAFRKYDKLKWTNPYQSMEYEAKRDTLINSFSEKVKFAFKETKPWVNQLSKGCQLCGQGDWSCLFITGICNANCFYCPAPQDIDDLPTSQKMEFEDPALYADFINHFGFKGCSFSGGEPLLAFDRTLHFLKTIRKNCSPDLYIWMYTNGILASEEKFKLLAEAGLNEVRFDIGATDYKLNGLKKAKGIIPIITVEIPAVPEEVNHLKELIPQLLEAGVTNLNLHQLRLTEHNANKLAEHDYSYLHGEHPTVLESEMAAMEIIRFVDKSGLPLGVNYCNFQYKNRFQKAGYRNKVASEVISQNEIVTENGFIRKIHVPINSTVEANSTGFFETPDLYKTILIDEFIAAHDSFNFAIIEYTGIILHNQKNKLPFFEYLSINKQNYPYEIGKPCNPIIILKEDFNELTTTLTGDGKIIPEKDSFFAIWKHEFIEFGRRDFF